MGRVIAGGILQVYTKVNFVPVDDIRFAELKVELPSNMPTAEELVQATKFVELHEAGRDCDIPFEGMELTTVVAESLRMKQLEHGPETFSLRLTALAIGPIVMLAIPGEPFTGIGRAVKAGSKYAPVFWPGEFLGLCSLFGHKELDTTEQLSLSHIRDCCMTLVYSDFSTVGNFVLRGQRQHLEIFFYCSTWSALKAEVPGKR